MYKRQVQNASIEAVCENFHALPEAWRDSTHLAARQEMLHASYLAGFAFTNNFVGYVHAIAHAVGALYHIPHGRANAVLLPAVLREYGSCIAPKLAVLADALSLGGDCLLYTSFRFSGLSESHSNALRSFPPDAQFL